MKQYITRGEHKINIIQTSIPTPTFAVKKMITSNGRTAKMSCSILLSPNEQRHYPLCPIMVGAEVRNFSLKLLAAKIVGIKFIKIKVSNALNNYILYHLDSVRHREFP